jgi:Tol biopolymer transport system component
MARSKANAVCLGSEHKFTVLSACKLLLLLAVVSCGSGGGGEEVITGTSDFPSVVFSADKDADGTVELFAAFNGGEDIIKLSGTMAAGGNVVDFKVAPDGIDVAYVADQDANNVFELYAVPIDKTAAETAVKISGSIAGSGLKEIAAGSGEYFFAWAPDSSRIAYIADQETAGVFELFTATPDGSDNVRVSGNLVNGGDVDAFAWSPQSDRIAYRADQNTDDALELYTAFPDFLGFQLVTSGISSGQNVRQFAWSPTIINAEQRIAFIADKDITGRFQLYTTSPNNNNNVLVSGVVPAGGNVKEFAWAPDGVLLAYRGDTRIDEVDELFTTGRATPLINRLSFLVLGGDVLDFAWAPDGSRIAYRAHQRTDNVIELFTNTSRGNQLSDKRISGSLPPGGTVTEFQWAPDSSRVAYIADQNTANVFELFSSIPDGSDNVQISGALVSGGYVLDFEWEPASALIAYVADQDAVDVQELYVSPADSDTPNFLVSGAVMAGTGIKLISEGMYAFAWAPDSSGVGYIADQNTDGIFELFASLPDGGNNTLLSGTLVNGGDVVAFEWVP